MNKLLIATLFFLITMSLSAQEMTTGIWLTGEENTKIETYQKDALWYGKIISSDNPKAIIGKDILIGFVKEDNKWTGKLYAAKKDKMMDAVISPLENELNITVSAGFFKKKLYWLREEEP